MKHDMNAKRTINGVEKTYAHHIEVWGYVQKLLVKKLQNNVLCF